MTHKLSFDVSKLDSGATIITPFIDGVALTQLAEQFEKTHEMTDPAGGYGGLIPENFRCGPLDQYFLGKTERAYITKKSGRIYVLGCECGEVGCWPLTCSVNIEDGQVVWSGFEQEFRPARDYSSFGPFVFDLQQYKEALRTLPESQSIQPVIDAN
jgi:hypothetical protein